MDFDWMNVELPRPILERNAAVRAASEAAEIRIHASLLRRLGYDAAYTKHRLLGNRRWTWELVPGSAAINEKQLRAEVDAAYSR